MTVCIDTKYITLGQLLKHINLISSGGEAKWFLNNNTVKINQTQTTSRGQKIVVGDSVSVNDNTFEIVSC
jgi:ribosome-associated protein